MYVVPGDPVSSSEGVVCRSGLDSVSCVVVGVVESVASLVFFHSVDDRSVRLTVVG